MTYFDPPVPGAYESLSEGQQSAVRRWLGVLTAQAADPGRTSRTVGLWVQGAPRSGTTYAASVAVKLAVRTKDQGKYGIEQWEYITARDLEQLVRESWSDAARQHPDDYGLWEEGRATELLLDRLWTGCDLLWVDDLQRGSTDMAFFQRHVYPALDARVKQGKALVVATSLGASQLGDLTSWVQVRFVTLDCAHLHLTPVP